MSLGCESSVLCFCFFVYIVIMYLILQDIPCCAPRLRESFCITVALAKITGLTRLSLFLIAKVIAFGRSQEPKLIDPATSLAITDGSFRASIVKHYATACFSLPMLVHVQSWYPSS